MLSCTQFSAPPAPASAYSRIRKLAHVGDPIYNSISVLSLPCDSLGASGENKRTRQKKTKKERKRSGLLARRSAKTGPSDIAVPLVLRPNRITQ